MATVLERITPIKAKKPEAGTVHWFKQCLDRGQREPFAEVITVTPALADYILQNNPDNRALKPIKQGHYATDMVSGGWELNGETIIVAKDGSLNDGQNRLRSIVEAQTPQPTFIAFGVERKTRTSVDQGAARSAGDYLTMLGIPQGNQCAGVARLVMAFERNGGKNIRGRRDVTNTEIKNRVLSDDAIVDAARFGHATAKYLRGMASPSVIGACLYILRDECRADADAYIGQVAYGEGIKRGDPAFAVRMALVNHELQDAAIRMEFIFRGWNAYRQNRPLSLAKTLGTFPALV